MCSSDLTVLDINPNMLEVGRQRAEKMSVPGCTFVEANAEELPLPDNTFDAYTIAFGIRNVPRIDKALREARRVLKPQGELLFVEHGASPDAAVLRWQQRLNPVWKVLAGGCHLDRPAADLIRAAGLRIDELSAAYLEGPRFMTYTYEGMARPS